MTEIITSKDVAEHIVNRGATLLDQHAPDWASRINVDTLNIASASHCVVAQLFGKVSHDSTDPDRLIGMVSHDYMIGVNRLKGILADSGITVGWDFERVYGFMTSWIRRNSNTLEGLDMSAIDFDSDGEIWVGGPLLTEAWQAAIAERMTVAV